MKTSKQEKKRNEKNSPGGDRTRDPRISLFYKYDALPTVLRGLFETITIIYYSIT